jgi:hypothetical protein
VEPRDRRHSQTTESNRRETQDEPWAEAQVPKRKDRPNRRYQKEKIYRDADAQREKTRSMTEENKRSCQAQIRKDMTVQRFIIETDCICLNKMSAFHIVSACRPKLPRRSKWDDNAWSWLGDAWSWLDDVLSSWIVNPRHPTQQEPSNPISAKGTNEIEISIKVHRSERSIISYSAQTLYSPHCTKTFRDEGRNADDIWRAENPILWVSLQLRILFLLNSPNNYTRCLSLPKS